MSSDEKPGLLRRLCRDVSDKEFDGQCKVGGAFIAILLAAILVLMLYFIVPVITNGSLLTRK